MYKTAVVLYKSFKTEYKHPVFNGWCLISSICCEQCMLICTHVRWSFGFTPSNNIKDIFQKQFGLMPYLIY